MRLEKYLQTRGESQNAFAQRAGLPRSTVQAICSEGRIVSVDGAIVVIRATGGLVALEDLGSPRPRRPRAA